MTKKVLIIDDDVELCEEMVEILQDQGYDTSVAFDGLKGKKLIEKYDYDVLLLDLKIPGLHGLDILRSIKERKKELKVLILTGKPLIEKFLKEEGSSENREDNALKLADAVISKPFDIETLLGKIKELIGRPKG